jgi:adenosylhomocysteine nucleosidase
MSGCPTVILISADAEWRALGEWVPHREPVHSPFGDWFQAPINVNGHKERVIFFHGGWGKIAAAASTQYVIDQWHPGLLINLGTCGGFAGAIERGAIVLAEQTVVYDIIEQMGDYDEHIDHYSTTLDLSWLPAELPLPVVRTRLVSGDRDLMVDEIPWLKERFAAVAGDWESGAIAWVAHRNRTRCLILRGVTDLVDGQSGEAYGNLALFEENANHVLGVLVDSLPGWLASLGNPD